MRASNCPNKNSLRPQTVSEKDSLPLHMFMDQHSEEIPVCALLDNLEGTVLLYVSAHEDQLKEIPLNSKFIMTMACILQGQSVEIFSDLWNSKKSSSEFEYQISKGERNYYCLYVTNKRLKNCLTQLVKKDLLSKPDKNLNLGKFTGDITSYALTNKGRIISNQLKNEKLEVFKKISDIIIDVKKTIQPKHRTKNFMYFFHLADHILPSNGITLGPFMRKHKI